MITCQKERFIPWYAGAKEMLQLHYEELALNKEKVPLDPLTEVYESMDENGYFFLATMREDGNLVGYYLGVVAPALHYRTCKTCLTDIFYVDRSRRGGMLGVKLFEFVEEELKKLNVRRWDVSSKILHDASALFRRCGFAPVETVYTKWIGE